jgi:N-methylhydantoinase A
VFPVNASVLSAFGTLVTPVRIDLARSMVRGLDDIDVAERDALLDELRAEGRRVLSAAGVPPDAVRFRYGIDARYTGQGNEITVWVGEGETWPATAAEVSAHFDADYERIYGLTIPDIGVEAVTWRLSAFAPNDAVEPVTPLAERGMATPRGSRPVRFTRAAETTDVPVYRRDALGPGAKFDGPAIVEERETTSVIRPGWSVEVAADGSLVATRTGGPS